MNLDYEVKLFKNPFDEYYKTLSVIQTKMISFDEQEDLRGQGEYRVADAKALILMMRYLKTEVAFAKLKHSEVVERKIKEDKLDLGAEKIDIDVRVKLMEAACQDLR